MEKNRLATKVLMTSVILVAGMTSAVMARGSGAVNLRSAANFAILSESGITDVPTSRVTGNVGTSPISGAALLLTCAEVTGTIYTVDAAGPLPCSVKDSWRLTSAVRDMETAYDDAAGRAPTVTELGAGNIGGMTLAPGVYKWSSGVTIPTDLTLSGSKGSVWIFQIAQNLELASATKIILARGATADNVFWQVGGLATLDTTSVFQGILLSKTMIAANTGAQITGRLFAQTAVTLQKNVVKQPGKGGSRD
jgi:hypothetical protein